MPNIVTVLKEEIVRLARKEVRGQTNVLRRASAQYRRDIAAMKRCVSDLQRTLVPLQKQALKNVPAQTEQADAEHVRFTAKGLLSQRKRLGLSAADYGRLAGVTSQTIYSWERGISRPRKSQLARIAPLRSIGKREAYARLEQMAAGAKKSRRSVGKRRRKASRR